MIICRLLWFSQSFASNLIFLVNPRSPVGSLGRQALDCVTARLDYSSAPEQSLTQVQGLPDTKSLATTVTQC